MAARSLVRRPPWPTLLVSPVRQPASRPCPSCRALFHATVPRLAKPRGPIVRAIPRPVTGKPRISRPPLPTSSPTSSSSPSSSSSPESLQTLFAQRKFPLIGAALAAGVLGFYIMPLLVAYLTGGCSEHDHAEIPPDAVPSGLPPVGAAEFDASLDLPERIMGIKRLRQRLATQVRGHVLEVAVGTGRNLAFYTWGEAPGPAPGLPGTIPIRSFTGIDLSAEALGIARQRLRSAVPGAKAVIPKRPAPEDADLPLGAAAVDAVGSRLRLLRADAMQPLPPPAAAAATTTPYDTIVQTFGLCSVADPVVLLTNMANALRPDSGRILLLEHGRGRWPLVNNLLDRYATRHFARFGCWWNRDMDAILAAAQKAVPGLEVVAVNRPGWFQFDTLWWIELRVRGKS